MTEPLDTVAVVLIAHGSRAEAANEAHQAMCGALSRELEVPVLAAFLELAGPSIPEAIASASARAERVVVLPHFLYPGRHVVEDIPALVAEGKARAHGVDVQLLPPSGEGEPMVALLASILRAALAD